MTLLVFFLFLFFQFLPENGRKLSKYMGGLQHVCVLLYLITVQIYERTLCPCLTAQKMENSKFNFSIYAQIFVIGVVILASQATTLQANYGFFSDFYPYFSYDRFLYVLQELYLNSYFICVFSYYE
jgi:hypothetical protein